MYASFFDELEKIAAEGDSTMWSNLKRSAVPLGMTVGGLALTGLALQRGKQLRDYSKARKIYDEAGGHLGRKIGDKWKDVVEKGNKAFGRTHSNWAMERDYLNSMHDVNKLVGRAEAMTGRYGGGATNIGKIVPRGSKASHLKLVHSSEKAIPSGASKKPHLTVVT